MSETKLTRVNYGERIEQLATRVLGKPARYTEILALNPTLDIWYPQANQQVEVPNGR